MQACAQFQQTACLATAVVYSCKIFEAQVPGSNVMNTFTRIMYNTKVWKAVKITSCMLHIIAVLKMDKLLLYTCKLHL
jgi:hypothetical protein